VQELGVHQQRSHGVAHAHPEAAVLDRILLHGAQALDLGIAQRAAQRGGPEAPQEAAEAGLVTGAARRTAGQRARSSLVGHDPLTQLVREALGGLDERQ
jgi:hypothetical protein